jgi:hypothetical protein
MTYDKSARLQAIASLLAYLDANPDLRVGQAVLGLFANESECWNASDRDLYLSIWRRLPPRKRVTGARKPEGLK